MSVRYVSQIVKAGTRMVVGFAWSFLSVFLVAPKGVFAGGTPPDPCLDPKHLCNPIKFPNLTDFLLAIVNTAIQYGAVLIVFFIVYAGFKLVVAQGNSEKVSEARHMLTWIVIGAFVLLGVYVIRAAICGTIGQLGVTVECKLPGES